MEDTTTHILVATDPCGQESIIASGSYEGVGLVLCSMIQDGSLDYAVTEYDVVDKSTGRACSWVCGFDDGSQYARLGHR